MFLHALNNPPKIFWCIIWSVHNFSHDCLLLKSYNTCTSSKTSSLKRKKKAPLRLYTMYTVNNLELQSWRIASHHKGCRQWSAIPSTAIWYNLHPVTSWWELHENVRTATCIETMPFSNVSSGRYRLVYVVAPEISFSSCSYHPAIVYVLASMFLILCDTLIEWDSNLAWWKPKLEAWCNIAKDNF